MFLYQTKHYNNYQLKEQGNLYQKENKSINVDDVIDVEGTYEEDKKD